MHNILSFPTPPILALLTPLLLQLTVGVEDLLKEEAHLRALIHDMQERVDWLRSGSCEKFGVVTERKVVVVMDSYAISNVTFGSFCSAVAAL